MSIFDEKPDRLPQNFGFIMTEDFSLMAFASVIEPMRAANSIANKTLFTWTLLTLDGEPVRSSSGMQIVPDGKLDETRFDAIFLIGGINTERIDDVRLLNGLRRALRMGASLVGVSTGSFVFGKAGILNNRRCTVHWDYRSSFEEAFPHLDVSDELYEIDGPVITCAGGAAAMDLMLYLLGRQFGHELATLVGDWFVQSRMRDKHEHQRTDLRFRTGISHPKLLAAVAMMEENLEIPLNREEIADSVDLSTRQMERLFRKYLRSTPKRYYFTLRMHKAQSLLRQTTMPILDVAIACGFVSASHFAKCYREYFGLTPRDDRGPSH